MANSEHLAFLKECLAENNIQKWNDWIRNTEGLPEKEIVLWVIPRVRKVDLSKADLSGFNLREIDLGGTDLSEANLTGAYLKEVNLRGANLEKTNLEEADLRGANLEGINLRGANLKGANLRRANLEGADLREANLDDDQREYAKFHGAIVSEEPAASELAKELRTKDQLSNEISQQRKEVERLKAEKDNLLNDTTQTKEQKNQALKKIKELENEIKSKENAKQALNKKINTKLENAIKELQRPNAYIETELTVYKWFFKCYIYAAIVSGIAALALSLIVFWTIDRTLATSNNPGLFNFLHSHGLPLTLWVLAVVFVNLYSKARQRVHSLEERKRGVETLLGVLFAIKGLSASADKIMERIDTIMDDLSKIAVSNYVQQTLQEEKDEGEVDSFIERLRKLINGQ